jgi:heptosyltransferase-2/heptosyltransferase-3
LHKKELELIPEQLPRSLHPTVIYFGRLGDMVMLSALLALLRRRFRASCHVIGAGSWNGAVFGGNVDVDGVWSFDRHLPFVLSPAWASASRALRSSHPGPIYVCDVLPQKVSRALRMLAFAGIDRTRCVFMSPDDASQNASWFDRLLRLGERMPAALSPADYPMPSSSARGAPRLQVLDSERQERDTWLRRHDCVERPLVIVQACNHRSVSRSGREFWRTRNSDDKSWPVESWAALLRKIHARLPAARILLRGARPELPVLREIESAAALDTVLVADPTLRTFFALCERAHSMISVDTGPAHAAAALGVPLVVLYGAQSPHLWLPRSPVGSPVIPVGGPPAFRRADEIAVESVFEAWHRLLEPSGAAQPREAVHEHLRASAQGQPLRRSTG